MDHATIRAALAAFGGVEAVLWVEAVERSIGPEGPAPIRLNCAEIARAIGVSPRATRYARNLLEESGAIRKAPGGRWIPDLDPLGWSKPGGTIDPRVPSGLAQWSKANQNRVTPMSPLLENDKSSVVPAGENDQSFVVPVQQNDQTSVILAGDDQSSVLPAEKNDKTFVVPGQPADQKDQSFVVPAGKNDKTFVAPDPPYNPPELNTKHPPYPPAGGIGGSGGGGRSGSTRIPARDWPDPDDLPPVHPMPARVVDDEEPFAPISTPTPGAPEERRAYARELPGIPQHPSGENDPAEVKRIGALADRLWPAQDWEYHIQTFARRFWSVDIEVAINQAFGAKAERPYGYINATLSRWFGETKGRPKHGDGANPGTVRVLRPGDKGPEQVKAEREHHARTLEHHKAQRAAHESRLAVEAEARARWEALGEDEKDRVREAVKAQYPDLAGIRRAVDRLCLAEVDPRIRELG